MKFYRIQNQIIYRQPDIEADLKKYMTTKEAKKNKSQTTKYEILQNPENDNIQKIKYRAIYRKTYDNHRK